MMKDIMNVECPGGYQLNLTFEGGERRTIDIKAYVDFKGVFGPLKDPRVFRQVEVNPEVGTIVWPNGADLCPDVLYEASHPVGSSTKVSHTP